MKKIYSFMLALLATLCVGVAYAEDPVTITINVDNPNAIEVTMTEGYGEIVLSLKAGDNEVKIPYNAEYGEYEILSAKAKSGYLVDSLTVSPADAPEWNDYSAWGWGYEFHPTAECDGAVYSFHTSNLNDLRKDSVIFIIDNPSDVQVMYYGSGSINIKEDTSVVYYCGDETVEALQDLPLTVQPAYGKLIYKVFHNDTELKKIESWDGEYYAVKTPENGDTVRVLTKAPEGTVAPAILELDSVALEALDSVMVNGAKVELKDTLIVPWGETVELAFNIEDYKVTVNNTPLSNYSNPYTAVVTDTTKIVATAEAYEKYDVTLILHDYTCFDQLYVDDYIFPKQDTTILTMSSKSPRITLYAATGCIIDSIKWQDVKQNSVSIKCEEEGVLEAWAHKIVRNQKFMLYVQKDSMNYSSVSTKQRHYFCDYYSPLKADYTECAFSVADDNPINASFDTKSGNKAVCYLNDSILTPGMWGSYEITLAEGDVLKAFADTAKVYTVSFALAEGAEISDVKKDHITAIDATKEYSVLEGTEVTFKTAATVTVDGKQFMAYKGVYTVPVVANTVITLGEPLSIANTVETPYTIEDAIMLTDAGVALTDTVFVIGIVDRIGTTATDIAKYGNVDVYLTDGELTYEFFRMLNVGGEMFADSAAVSALFAVGDTLIAKGTLTYYAKNDMYELNQKCQLVEVRKLVIPSIANTAENPYSVTEAIELTKAGVALTDSVYVIGIVDSLQYVAKYKDVNVWVHDSLNRMEFYAMYGFNRDSINSEEDLAALVAVGDTLIAKGTLTYYAKGDIYELNKNCYAIEVRKVPIIEEPSIVNTAENPYTVTEAIELTKAGVSLTDSVYVIGIVDSLQYVADYKDVNVWVHDSLNRMEFYAMYGFNRDSINSEEDLAALVAVGDTLIAKGTLTYYAKGDIYELNKNCYAIEVRKAAVEPEPEPEIAQYQLHGSWVENWGGPVLEIAEDQATATATVEMNAGNYGFGIKQIDAAGAQIAWLLTANVEGDTFTREANAFVFVNEKEVSGKNPTLAADVDGVYTFVWTYADNTLTITFPAKPEGIFNTTVNGQAEKFVRDGQLIIRMNGVEYNVLGAKIQ